MTDSGYSNNIGMLLAFRLLPGLFGSPVLATGSASLGDMFSNSKRSYAIGLWGLFAVCSPAMGPCLVSYIQSSLTKDDLTSSKVTLQQCTKDGNGLHGSLSSFLAPAGWFFFSHCQKQAQ